MNRDKLTPLQKVACEQQASLLAHAHSQALKMLIEDRQVFKLSVDDALAYLNMAKIMLNEVEFKELLFLMSECSKDNCEIIHVLGKIANLLQAYPELLQGFGMFLPPDLNLQLQTGGLVLLKKVKTEKEEPSPEKCEVDETVASSSAEDGKENICKETNPSPFNTSGNVLEKKSPITIKEIDADFAKSYLTKVKERFHDEPQVFERFLELLDSVRNDTVGAQSDIENDVFLEVGELFRGQDDLIAEFKTFVPNASHGPHEEDFMDTSDKVPENSDENSLSQSDAIDLSKISIVNDPSIAPVYKFGSYEEHQFFDNVRSAVGHREVFDNFLRCLMLYNEDVITKSELLKLSTSFLGKFPNLHRQFKDILGFKESGENIETIPMKIISLENLRSRPEVGTDIDYSAGGRNGASYRALPKDFEQPKCSGRTALCKEVLNDTWVSFPSWSEDSTFVTSCKTQYEEIIYRCEDERFELDMAISANIYTLQILENVQKKINKMTTDEKSMFSLDDSLGGTSTVLQQRALHRLYGDKTEELVEGLKRNPLVAVPIILKRLKVKEDEWKEKELKFNDLWRNQIDHYYLKSLDHQGINFKQNDSKSFRPKSLLNEMEMVYAENKENHVNSAHFVLEFKEMDVFLDAINLMLQYLKKLTGVYRDDRRRIELVVRSFIPDFFGAPRATKSEEDMEVEEEIREPMEVENDGEERSAQNSSAGSNRDEGSSDQDESISNEENELSDEADKTFIEESDVFDKMDPLPVTNLPYALFLVSKTWFIFFRQFHILCERLSRLLFESNRKEIHVKKEEGTTEEVYVSIEKVKPSYKQLIEKLSQLLSGSIDYNQFEEEARSLFGIHAFVSFTMDKLVLTIVRQLQQIVADDICKQCTAFFIQHTKVISAGGHTSPLEASQIEYEYLRKVEKMMDDEQCFKVVWHKKDHTLTIELLEQETEENCPDPREAEKWSNYLDAYVTGDSCCEEIPFQHSPVILPRNLRKQLLYWKNKAVQMDKLWKTKQSAKLIKKHLPLSLRKRRALSALSPILRKMPRRSSAQESGVPSPGSVVASNDTNQPKPTEDNVEVQAEHIAVDEQIAVDDTKDAEISVDDTKEAEISLEDKKDTDDRVINTEDIVVDENEPEKSELIVIDLEGEPMGLQEESIVDVIDHSTNIQTEEVPLESPKSITESGEKDLDDISADEIKLDPVQEEPEPMKVEDEPESSTANDEKNDIVDVSKGSTEEQVSEDKRQDKSLFDENVLDVIGSEMDIHSRIEAIETAHRVMASINVENEEEENVVAVSDSDSIGKAESSLEKPLEKRPVKRRIIRKPCDYSIKTRKNRIHQSYVRRRMKRGIVKTVQSSKGKRRRQVKPKSEFFDDPNFDFMHFSELPENEKGSYLAFKYVTIEDEVEGAFRKGSYKIYFVQNCDLYVYRKHALIRAKEIHQAISEIKTSNFNAWHRIWLDRYVTPSMLKYCNDWFHKSDAEKFKLVRVTVSDCTRPPYIPYNKYRVRYYKVDT